MQVAPGFSRAASLLFAAVLLSVLPGCRTQDTPLRVASSRSAGRFLCAVNGNLKLPGTWLTLLTVEKSACWHYYIYVKLSTSPASKAEHGAGWSLTIYRKIRMQIWYRYGRSHYVTISPPYRSDRQCDLYLCAWWNQLLPVFPTVDLGSWRIIRHFSE